jgi:hypothetical protein
MILFNGSLQGFCYGKFEVSPYSWEWPAIDLAMGRMLEGPKQWGLPAFCGLAH